MWMLLHDVEENLEHDGDDEKDEQARGSDTKKEGTTRTGRHRQAMGQGRTSVAMQGRWEDAQNGSVERSAVCVRVWASEASGLATKAQQARRATKPSRISRRGIFEKDKGRNTDTDRTNAAESSRGIGTRSRCDARGRCHDATRCRDAQGSSISVRR